MKETAWLFHGGRILDARRATAAERVVRSGARERHAEAVLVRGELIEAVGPVDRLRRFAPRGVKVVNLRGGTLMPGFVDAHIHLLTWIRAMEDVWIQTQNQEGLEQAVRAAEARAPDAEWITLRGWIPRDWPRALKVQATLDRVRSERPLVLFAIDGHSAWGNSAALERAGIGPETPDPPGGRVDRDASGALSGILIEEAAWLIRRGRRDPAAELTEAIRRAHLLGITGACDFDRTDIWPAAQELAERDRLPFRLLLSIPAAKLDAAEELGIRSRWGSERLRVGPVKFFADGTLGSGTALLEARYEDDTGTGMEVISPLELEERCARAGKAGLTVAIHAIGDRAVRNALDAIEGSLKRGPFPIPPRIEHIQLVREEDIPRFKALGVLASVQPIHQVTDRAVARRKWGARTARSYAYRSLQRAGARLLFGSDAPFDRAGPLLAIQAALLRRRGGEPESAAFHPEQRLGWAACLRAHLEEPNRLAGWRTPLGRIQEGWGADLVRYDQDLLRTDPETLHQVAVRAVWVAGRLVTANRSEIVDFGRMVVSLEAPR
ncbi:MAG TPA: amidohydrolase [Candidatus Saccharimonadales bacterium]|nr:amidohydrolase [Candidatus Saccharimonadales bacterium]